MSSLLDFRRSRMMLGVPPKKTPYDNIQLDGTVPTAPMIDRSATPAPIAQPQDDIYSQMQRMYNAPSPALDKYKQYVSTMPSRDDYKPTKINRLGAALVGASEGLAHGGGAGANAAQGFLDKRYNTALGDYANKGMGLKELADIESTDMKGKLSFANTMADNDLAKKKFEHDVSKDNSDLELRKTLTDAQVANFKSQAATRGITYHQNKSDGHLYQVSADGSKKDLGAFDMTPEQAANLEVKTYTKKEGVQLANSKNLFEFQQPIKDKSEKEVHLANREADAANPIPTSGLDGTAPSQYKIADDQAVTEVLRSYPGWAKYVDQDMKAALKAQTANTQEFKKFTDAVTAKRNEIIQGGLKRPTVSLNAPKTNPLNPTDDKSLRARAIKELTDAGKDTAEANIQYVINQLKKGAAK